MALRASLGFWRTGRERPPQLPWAALWSSVWGVISPAAQVRGTKRTATESFLGPHNKAAWQLQSGGHRQCRRSFRPLEGHGTESPECCVWPTVAGPARAAPPRAAGRTVCRVYALRPRSHARGLGACVIRCSCVTSTVNLLGTPTAGCTQVWRAGNSGASDARLCLPPGARGPSWRWEPGLGETCLGLGSPLPGLRSLPL